VLILTSLRAVWYSVDSKLFNASVPYLQMKSVEARDSGFGRALVLTTPPSSGGYVLGFSLDSPPNGVTVDTLATQISGLREVSFTYPFYGFDGTGGVICVTLFAAPAASGIVLVGKALNGEHLVSTHVEEFETYGEVELRLIQEFAKTSMDGTPTFLLPDATVLGAANRGVITSSLFSETSTMDSGSVVATTTEVKNDIAGNSSQAPAVDKAGAPAQVGASDCARKRRPRCCWYGISTTCRDDKYDADT
jgi:hypothetical protein